MTGQQDILEWLENGEHYSFTGLTREILNRPIGRDKNKPLNGNAYWVHPEFGHRTLLNLREADVTGDKRERDDSTTLEE